MVEKTMDKIVALAKSRGFVYPGSEIYGGLANTWDYGPLGVELKNNVKRAWWKKFIQENPYNVGVDCAILMNPQTWVASGHLGGFSDPLMDCKECKTRHRADNLIEDFDGTNVAGWTNEEMMNYIKEKEIPCPNCGKHNFTDIRQFNLMFKTFQGVTEDSKNEIYLRSIEDEVDSSGEETGRLILKGFSVGYKNRLDMLKFAVGLPKAVDFIKKNWDIDSSVKVEGYIRNRFVEKSTTDEIEDGFGEAIDFGGSGIQRELVITRGGPVDRGWEEDDLRRAAAMREERIETEIAKAKASRQKKANASSAAKKTPRSW